MTDHKATKKTAKEYFFAILRRKYVFFTLAILITAVLVHLYRAPSPPPREALKPQFSKLNWPKSLTQINHTYPVVVALRTEPSGFPTVNIIELPGEIERRDPQKAIVDSYRSLGMTDVVSKNSRYPDSLELGFSSRGEEFWTSVTLIDGGKERHYALTFMDSRKNFENHRHVLQAVMDEVQSLRYHQPADVQIGR